MGNERLLGRNAAIANMFTDSDQLKNYYRFIALNPHINLHDACNILLARPNATVCYPYEEWNELGRQVIRGKKSIAYYDYDGYKQFVFDVSDTRGESQYNCSLMSREHLLVGLNELVGTDLLEAGDSDYTNILKATKYYLNEQGIASEDELRSELLAEGIAYSLYSKTGLHQNEHIDFQTLPFSFKGNAEFVKEVYVQAELLAQEIEDAYKNKQEEIKVLYDTEEETLSDEPKLPESTKTIVQTHSAIISNYKGYDVLLRWINPEKNDREAEVYLGKRENYDNRGHYDNSDNSLVLISKNERIFDFLHSSEWVFSQQEMIDKGFLTEKDYKEFYELENGILKDFEKISEIKFAVDVNVNGSGESFKYPNWQSEQTADNIKQSQLTPYYQTYIEAQKTRPNAIVLIKTSDTFGDYYVILGENAKNLATEKDFTCIHVDVGLSKKVPMCSVPQKYLEDFVNELLERHSVLLIEDDKEPKFILSHAEALEQSARVEEKPQSKLTEIDSDEPSPFDDEQSTDEDWRNELAEELGELADEQSNEELDEIDSSTDEQDGDENLEQEEKPIIEGKQKPTQKKPEKGIKDRKRKEQSTASLFDLLEPQEKSREEQMIERQLKGGSGFQHGKFRIFDKYNENPSTNAFADFLKKEYGIGGYGRWDGDNQTHNAKGIKMSLRGEQGETLEEKFLKWPEVAVRIADLIDDDNYLTEQEKKNYIVYKVEQNRLCEQHAEEERKKNELINLVITSTDENRKQRILNEYAKSTELTEFAKFLSNEYGYSIEANAGYHAKYYADGVWLSKYYSNVNADISTYLKWEEFADKVCTLIENDRYIEYKPEEQLSPEQQKIKHIVGAIVEEGIKKTTDGKWFNYFEDFKDDEQFVREYKNEIAQQLVLRKEVAEVGMDDNCIDTTFHLEYCSNYDWNADEEAEEQEENTDLANVLDQSELGGAKTRFRNNVEAIKLVNRLYAANRNPTEDEKKVLAKFVGWGGLSQAFDEKNESWNKEYAELKGLLSQEDYEQARSSTLNAYYTAKDVINGIYMALNRFGVRGNNRILEPSMGTGNFFGFMPKEIADGAKLYGVELDNLTGRIATKLYPQANVQIKGFEDTNFPDDRFDIIVGNVPFGGYGVADSAYNKYNFKVHDYFLAKSIDKVKPNGIVAIITSKGTMDKLNQSARKYVAERADLIGAIRLPNIAFKQTAGTEAVADILFFRKREKAIAPHISSNEWISTGKTAEGFEINQYFINHPEMVLGTLAEETGLYGGVDTTVKPDGRELTVALSEAISHLPKDIYNNPEVAPEAEVATLEDYNIKPFCYKAINGKLYMRIGDELREQQIPKFPKDAYQRIEGMIELREELHHVLDMQSGGCSDEVLRKEQAKLNRLYDLFVKRYGNINGQTNIRLFKDDGDSALLFACEDIDEETKAITKSDVFSKRTIRPYIVPTNTDDCFEALQISKNERGKVDISYIEELTGKSYDDVIFELGDSIFRDPEITDREDKYSGFKTSEEYLSGLVKDKLQTARRYAAEFPEYQRNVEALEQVQPTPLTASEIAVRLGQTWVDKDYYKQFYCELVKVPWYMQSDVELFYNPHDSSWRLDQKDNVRYNTQMYQKQVYGTNRAPAYRLFIDSMNLRPTTIYDTVVDADGKERRVLNQAETISAREKQNKIKEEFVNWIFANPERREELEATYNRLFNRIKLPSYDGSYLKFPEMNPAIELKPHQKNAIHRIITSKDSTLLHHVVGSGKTYTIVASIMKMRQLGLCKKAMVTVPNHLVQQWASEWRKLYPNAKILVATKEDLEKDNRQKFVSKVAMGDWDGIIIAQSSFAKIPISSERQIKKLEEEIESVELTIKHQWEEKGMPRGAVKNLERIKKSRQAQLKKLMDDSKKDGVLIFEKLGVDYLYVDEAHYYKNLFLFSKMSNVAGISNAASQRASDLKLKCEYLQELHGNDRGVVFATGTPISNSMTEMYTMQSYLQPKVLKDTNIMFFDGWAADFGETITSMELAPSGQGYRARTRFAKFTNLPELLTMYRSFADVQTADMVKLNVPEAERRVVNLKPSETTIQLAEEIAERAEMIYGGNVDSHIDNMLKVTSDGKKLALDPRCYVPTSDDEQGSKLNEAAQRIHEVWEETAESKGTQIVFCDLSTPKRKFEEYEYGKHFDAYNELKYKLVQKGIPAEEISFIHDAKTDEQKQALFDNVNSGEIRVLIGSTEKCGAGTNVQKRLVALHHLDTPYRPSDMAQREGRIIRQGNTNEKVQIFTYVTERTFDSYSYQILENKQRFISQIDRGDLTVREAEDIDETTLSYAEIKAITAANPKIKRKMEVDTDIARLRVLEGQYRKNLYDLQDKILKGFPEDIRKQELLIERVTLDLMHFESSKPSNPEEFKISVNGNEYTDKKEGGQALMDALYASKPETVVAEYCGFKISMNPIKNIAGEREITLIANGQYTLNISDSAFGNLQRMDNFFNDLPARKDRLEKRLNQLNQDFEIAKEQVEKPFEQAEQLSALLSEQIQLNTELNLDKKEQSVVIEDGNDTDDVNYRMLPTQKDIREVNIINEEDKVASMKIEVLPDYSITQDEMHDYGYKWDGMLPLSRKTALKLWSMGLTVCKLSKDDDHSEVDDYSDFDSVSTTLYGIEKPVWKNYLNNEKSMPYLMARLQIVSAVNKMTSNDMNYIDDKFIGKFKIEDSKELTDLENVLQNVNQFDKDKVKSEFSYVLDEFTERLWCEELKYYGWTKSDIPKSIAENVTDAELKELAKNLTKTYDAKKELMVKLGGMSEEEIDALNLPVFDDELTVVGKEPSVYLDYEKYLSGVLALRNEITGDYYVINDTSAKGKNGKELEFGDKTDVETILAYDGLNNGNPLKEFHSESEAKTYFLEKVNAIRSVVANSTNVREAVKSSTILEFDKFKKEMLNKPSDEVFLNNYKIHCFNELGAVIEDDEEYFSDDDYQALYRERGHILESLYNDFLTTENYNLEDYDSKLSFIKDYCEYYHSDIYCNKPVYLQSAGYAVDHDEMGIFRSSYELSFKCKTEIESAISNNYDGMYLKSGFEDELIKKYGIERVACIVATTIREHETDGRFSRANKDWANTIPIFDSETDRRTFSLNVHPAVLDGFTDRIRKKIKEKEKEKLEENKFLKVTPQGYKVLSITKDKDDRNIAIIHREQQNDYIVAARYDTSDGKWAQGEYCATLKAAEEYKYEKYDKFVLKDTGKRNWIFAHVAKEALVAKHQFTSFFRFPTYSPYAGYGYSIFNNRIKEGRQITDLQSDSRELCYDIRLAEDEEIILKHSTKEEIKLTARNLMELVSGTSSKDYDPKPRVEVNIPKEAKRNVYENSTMFVLPNSAAEDSFTYFIPNRYITNGTDENEGRIILSIPEDFEIKAQNKDEEEIIYTLQEFTDLCNGTTADDYKGEENADGETDENSSWHYVSVDKSARVAQYDNSSLFKMPKGELEGYTYYIPNGFIKENEEKGTIRIGLPEEFVVKPKDNVSGDEKSMTVEEFVEQVKNKKPNAYRYFQKPSDEAKAQFVKVEERLRRNIPEEMKERPNWVAIVTFEKENGKLGKRPIDCKTGKYASDIDPETWVDFDTACDFARDNGAVTLAYALDGKDKIACIDLDGCMQDDGDFTELAQKTFNLGKGTYCERSISGKGLHIFGKTDGMDLRSFSKDGDMEFYRKARFIAVTGDYYGSSELKSFDNAEMKGLLESKFNKRPEIKNAGKGVEGFSTMSDRDVYDKACASYRGERFKALFEGQDLQNNHSNSDMSLMNLLAFWCNGDKEQMLRMFSASGLYRHEKSADYYECTMLKALEGTTDRYNPQPKTEQKKPTNNNNSGNNGKR
jgi:N12 class adenine-specific DNA methylase/primase-polymerase (primpol)-like protein